jgi:hypothetical protein
MNTVSELWSRRVVWTKWRKILIRSSIHDETNYWGIIEQALRDNVVCTGCSEASWRNIPGEETRSDQGRNMQMQDYLEKKETIMKRKVDCI